MPIYYSKITHATMFYIISVRIKKKLAFFFPFEQTKCVCMKKIYIKQEAEFLIFLKKKQTVLSNCHKLYIPKSNHN